jgi:hypothetical protein
MIMMPYNWPWSSLQLRGRADFWHPTGRSQRPGNRGLTCLLPAVADEALSAEAAGPWHRYLFALGPACRPAYIEL